MSLYCIGSGCADCVDGACTMNCSSALMATGTEWIAASIWSGVFPRKAPADQVLAWRASRDSDRSGEAIETGTGSTAGESAGRQASPKSQRNQSDGGGNG